jgi:quercetin dioxygenase-like cupin family protein
MIKGALRSRIVFLIAIETGLLATVFAQNTGVKRDVVQRGDISVAGREAGVIHVEIAPGARTGRHTHPP